MDYNIFSNIAPAMPKPSKGTELLPTIRAMWKTQTITQVAAVRITPRAAEIPKAAEPPAEILKAAVWSKRTPRKTEQESLILPQ